jgi:hypothetical protein
MEKSVLSQLQSVSEEALERITKSQATRSAIQSAIQLKDRAGRTLSGLEGIEERLAAIEKRLTALEGQKKPATRTRSTAKKTAAKPAAKTASAPKAASPTAKPES